MNEERLLKIIQDMTESVENINECMSVIIKHEKDDTTKFIVFGLKQIFVDFFITVEDFTSIMLKELKQFRVGMDMKQGLEILKAHNILDEATFIFLNKARFIRNRILHRYKEPSKEELFKFINENQDAFSKVLQITKQTIQE